MTRAARRCREASGFGDEEEEVEGEREECLVLFWTTLEWIVVMDGWKGEGVAVAWRSLDWTSSAAGIIPGLFLFAFSGFSLFTYSVWVLISGISQVPIQG